MFRPIFIAVAFAISGAGASYAEEVKGLERKVGQSWEAYNPASIVVSEPRCVRLRNFWCLKQSGSSGWNGSRGKDSENHAIFDDPAFSSRAFIKTMRSYWFRHKKRTAREIFGRYAPSSDCIGSLSRHPVTGKCPKGENQPVVYARQVAKTLGVDLNDEIGLFNSDGVINTDVAVELAKAVAQFELGAKWRITEKLVIEGIKLSGIKSE